MEITFDASQYYYQMIKQLAAYWSGAVAFCTTEDFVMRHLNTPECGGWVLNPKWRLRC